MSVEWDRYRYLLCSIPAVIVLLAIVAVSGRAVWKREDINLSYGTMARQAMLDGDYDRARVYYSRIVAGSKHIHPQDEFNWADILSRGGDIRSAEQILDRLAPDDGIGFDAAHRMKAFRLALALEEEDADTEQILKLLRVHLRRSGNEDPLLLNKLWARYHLAAGQAEEAALRLAEAGQWEPELWLQSAKISATLGHREQRQRSLERAEEHFQARVAENPLDVDTRITLAGILIELERAEQADELLSKGMQLQDRAELRRALSDLCLYRLNRLGVTPHENFHAYSRELAKALHLDPTNRAVYFPLLAIYQDAATDEDRKQIRGQLEDLIVEGRTVAFAHFALGAIFWLEEDTENALWHMEKAYSHDANLLDVANNLAWLLAEKDPPELQRAFTLIESVVKQQPDDPRYRDTMALVLLKQERWEEALVEYETLLRWAQGENRIVVHERLATIYQELGKESIAEQHRRRVKDSRDATGGEEQAKEGVSGVFGADH